LLHNLKKCMHHILMSTGAYNLQIYINARQCKLKSIKRWFSSFLLRFGTFPPWVGPPRAVQTGSDSVERAAVRAWLAGTDAAAAEEAAEALPVPAELPAAEQEEDRLTRECGACDVYVVRCA
jgi:hypothetical protein